MKKIDLPGLDRPLLFLGLGITIPAFYLLLTGPTEALRLLGSAAYGLAALLVLLDVLLRNRRPLHWQTRLRAYGFDVAILCGMLLSAWPEDGRWSTAEWVFRVAVCLMVFSRLAQVMVHWLGPHHLFQVLGISVVLMAVSGAGFYWLEPNVHSYADGLWLAFTTAATVGYGDIVPSVAASRVFAVFIVLLGFAVFSVVTATIAALFVGEDERRFEKELHADIRALRQEIEDLRKELNTALAEPRPWRDAAG